MASITVQSHLVLERVLSIEIVRVTERAAVSAARLRGHGKDKASDQAAVDAMRRELNKLPIDGTVVIGEGELDEAPMLFIGEKVGNKAGPQVDIAVDQGGCFEDTRPTTHADPTYPVLGSVFYCVANMPGAVPNTSTYALTNATLPYVVALADKGWTQALRDDRSLALGLNCHDGRLTNAPVAAAHGLESVALEDVLG